MREDISRRGSAEPNCWVNNCRIQRPPAEYDDRHQRYRCHLHGSCKLSKCDFYNDWSEKEVRDAFKKLEETEKQLAIIRAIKEM